MLTPQEITEKVFVKAIFGGYDMMGVDDFLEVVSADYAALYKENAILKSKLKVLVEKVEEYRSTEDAMRMALLTAQRMSEEITLEANKHKEETLMGVELETKAKLAETAKLISNEELRLNAAVKETSKFIKLSQAIMQKHSEFLTKLETASRAVSPPPKPPEPTFKEQVADAAELIEGAVERITRSDAYAPENDPVPDYYDDPDAEPVMPYEETSESDSSYAEDDDEAAVTPRPKFDFDDLKFGSNFKKK